MKNTTKNSGLSRKLILVSAPAGYGKTTLISDWISQNKIQAAWLSLDIAFTFLIVNVLNDDLSEKPYALFGENTILFKSPS